MLYGVEAQDTFAPTPPPGGYVAGAVHFASANTSRLSIASLTATDNAFLSFSIWEKGFTTGGTNNGKIGFVGDAAGTYAPTFWISTGGETRVYTKNGTPQFRKFFAVSSTVWHHHLCSVDTNHGSGAKIMAYYLDDVLQTATTTVDATAAFINLFNGKSFYFGGDNTAFAYVTCDFADVWIGPGISLLTGSAIAEVDRRKFTDFITGTGCVPIDPTTWPTSAIQFYGNAASFPTNHGTGGAFTLGGSITDASTHP